MGANSNKVALGLPWVGAAVVVAFAAGTQCSTAAGSDAIASLFSRSHGIENVLKDASIPEKALVIDQRENLVWDHVPPPTEANATTVRVAVAKTITSIEMCLFAEIVLSN